MKNTACCHPQSRKNMLQDLSNKRTVRVGRSGQHTCAFSTSMGQCAIKATGLPSTGRLWPCQRKPKEDKRAIKRASAKREIGAFFDDASTPLPDKKHVSKVTEKNRALLDKPIREYYNDYASRGGQAAFSKFAKYRPSNVRTMMKSNLQQCLCEYCANVDLNCQMYAR